MRTAIRRNRGIVSKEGGDGLIALFGAPHADDNHAVMACDAAAELVRRINLLDGPALQAVLAMLFSAYQGWARAAAPLFVGLPRLAIVLVGGWVVLRGPVPRLDWLYYLVAGSVILAAFALGFVFLLWPPNRSDSVLSGGKGDR